jgi:hypothetical protein
MSFSERWAVESLIGMCLSEPGDFFATPPARGSFGGNSELGENGEREECNPKAPIGDVSS